MTILPKAIYRFNAIPIKLPRTFFHRTQTKYFKVCLEAWKTQNLSGSGSQRHPEKEKWSWRTWAPCLQTIWQSYHHQDHVVLAQRQKYRSVEYDRKPELNPRTYSQLIYDQEGKNIQWREDSPFNKWCWEKWTATCKRMKLEHFLTPYTKVNSKWIKDLNIRPDTIKPLQENMPNTLWHKP